MPEAGGYIALKVPENVQSAIVQEQDSITSDAIVLLEEATNTKFPTKVGWYEDAPKEVARYLLLTPFGMEWMDMAEQIVRHGSSVELYGRMSDEYGRTCYYALNADGARYLYTFDEEEDEVDEASFYDVKAKVTELTPSDLLEAFPDLYKLGWMQD